MPILILCSQVLQETREFLRAEQAAIKSLRRQKGMPKDSPVNILHLQELPASTDVVGIEQLAKEILLGFEMGGASFQAEFVKQADFPFLAIYSEVSTEPASKSIGIKKSPKLRGLKILAGTLGTLVLVFALYIGYGRYLAGQINTQYEMGQCAEVTRLTELGQKIYLPIIMSSWSSVFEHDVECQNYGTAVKAQQQEDWANAYAIYKDYLSRYPGGALASDAQENAAQTLLSWSKQEYETKQYEEAINHLQIFFEDYTSSPTASDAEMLLSNCYLEWGKALLHEQNFADALIKFNLATENDANPDDISGPSAQAQAEIPYLYLQWAESLANQGEFDKAIEKYTLVTEADSNPDDPSGPSAQARAELLRVHLQQADSLVSQGKFDEAITQYQTYLELVPSEDKTLAQEALAQGYLYWADALCGEEDFWSAFDKIDLAESNTLSEEIKVKIEQARANTYASFATSSGTQAQQLMDEAAKNLIEKKQTPELPIFGVDEENVRVYVYGEGENVSNVGNSISDDILPQTPGEMHYIANVLEDVETRKCTDNIRDPFGYAYSFYYTIQVPHWAVSIIDIKTGETLKRKGIYAKSVACPGYDKKNYYAEPPEAADLEGWLNTFIK